MGKTLLKATNITPVSTVINISPVSLATNITPLV